MRIVFKAAPGARFNDEDAQIIGQELGRMRKDKARITPENLVQRARAEDNPVHPYMTWDDSKAAESWRKEEARHLISHLLIVEVHKEQEVHQKAMYSLSTANNEPPPVMEREYLTISEIKKDELAVQQLATRAISELQGWYKRNQVFVGMGTFLDDYKPLFEFIAARMK
jgi:hypothetical protein